MIRSISNICLVAGLAAVTACRAGGGLALPSADESLLPQIAEDGTKFFVFERTYTRELLQAGEIVQTPDGDIEPSRIPAGGSSAAIERRLGEVMLTTGYCREGYFELYRERLPQRLSVRGECREAASDDDRVRFTGENLLRNL